MRPKVIAGDVRILELIKAKKIVISEVDKAAFTATVKSLTTEFPAGRNGRNASAKSPDAFCPAASAHASTPAEAVRERAPRELIPRRTAELRMKAVIGSLSNTVTEIAKFVLGLCVAAIVLITLAAVWWRYVVNAPIARIEQVSNILFIWITFIGAAVLYRQKLHIGVDMFIGMLKGRAQQVMFWVIETRQSDVHHRTVRLQPQALDRRYFAQHLLARSISPRPSSVFPRRSPAAR